MGMVDREGKERIPLHFVRSGDRHRQIEFFTPCGSLDDFAPVTVWTISGWYHRSFGQLHARTNQPVPDSLG